MALDENGLTIRRLPEVLDDLEVSLKENVDVNMDASTDTLFGQVLAIFADAISQEEAQAQAVYDSFNILKAEGRNLDDLAALQGLSRLEGFPTSGQLRVTGNDGVLVVAGSLFQNPITLDQFTNPDDLQLTTNSCISAKYSVKTLLNSTTYTIQVNDTNYSYTSSVSATNLEILNGIQTGIDADPIKTWTSSVDAVNEQIEIVTSDENNIAVTSVTYIGPDEVVAETFIECTVEGAVVAPENTVTVVLAGPSVTVTNPQTLSTGRDRETDEELRQRLLNGQQNLGVATVEAIRDRLEDTLGVLSASVVENDQTIVDGAGRPPKSFESIVDGGTDEDVATTIWLSKPAGIETFGNTTTIIQDSSGNDRTINFTRPTAINIAIRVSYTKYDEEVFPSDGEDTIRTTCVNHTNNLGLGVDVIPQRYFGDIFSAVAGIETLVVEVQTLANAGDPPVELDWQTTPIDIAEAEFASTTNLDVIVQEV
jgi:uncharacterized phage protein gp47/JayE